MKSIDSDKVIKKIFEEIDWAVKILDQVIGEEEKAMGL